MDIICKETLIIEPTKIEVLTVDGTYEIVDTDETGIYINNNQGDRHHFSPEHQEEYFKS